MLRQQPRGLSVLFFTEMWERFGFYIMEGLLIFYMTQHLDFSDSRSYEILGAFTALAYILPVLGGYIADHVLGYRQSIIWGNWLLILGYLMILIPGHFFLYLALAIIVMGTGFFKPNVSSLVGTLYEEHDPRRDTGFTIFYVGINLGVLLATTTVGFIQQHLGWDASFAMAAAGLVIAFFVFKGGQQYLGSGGLKPIFKNHNTINKVLRNKLGIGLVVAGSIGLSMLLIVHSFFADIFLIIASLLLIIIIVYKSRLYPQDVKYKLYALLILIATSVIFWAIYFQMFFSVNLFIERNVNRYIGSFEIPPILFISVESIGVIIFGFIMAKLWHSLAVKEKNPSTPIKFSLATVLIGLAFGLLWLSLFLSPNQLVNPVWVVMCYFLIAIAELALSAIGLSAVTILAPKDLVAFLMGIWFLALGWGGKLAGTIAKISSIPENITNIARMQHYYQHAFGIYSLFGIIVGIISLCLVPMVKKMMAGHAPYSAQ